MRNKPEDASTPKLSQSVLLWDDTDCNYVLSYRKDVKRISNFCFLDNVLFDSDAETFSSTAFRCAPYNSALVMVSIVFVSSPTDIVFHPQFSPDGENWYYYSEGIFSDFRFAATQGNLRQSFFLPVGSNFVSFYCVSSGCDSSNTILASINASFSS